MAGAAEDEDEKFGVDAGRTRNGEQVMRPSEWLVVSRGSLALCMVVDLCAAPAISVAATPTLAGGRSGSPVLDAERRQNLVIPGSDQLEAEFTNICMRPASASIMTSTADRAKYYHQ